MEKTPSRQQTGPSDEADGDTPSRTRGRHATRIASSAEVAGGTTRSNDSVDSHGSSSRSRNVSPTLSSEVARKAGKASKVPIDALAATLIDVPLIVRPKHRAAGKARLSAKQSSHGKGGQRQEDNRASAGAAKSLSASTDWKGDAGDAERSSKSDLNSKTDTSEMTLDAIKILPRSQRTRAVRR